MEDISLLECQLKRLFPHTVWWELAILNIVPSIVKKTQRRWTQNLETTAILIGLK